VFLPFASPHGSRPTLWPPGRTAAERAKIASSIMAVIEVKDCRIQSFRPRPAWAPYFDEIALPVTSKRETSVGLTQDHEWSGIRLVLTA
jgi:hypothetical protein